MASGSHTHYLVRSVNEQGETSIDTLDPGSRQISCGEERDGLAELRDLRVAVVVENLPYLKARSRAVANVIERVEGATASLKGTADELKQNIKNEHQLRRSRRRLSHRHLLLPVKPVSVGAHPLSSVLSWQGIAKYRPFCRVQR